jgi:hypothetical protein
VELADRLGGGGAGGYDAGKDPAEVAARRDSDHVAVAVHDPVHAYVHGHDPDCAGGAEQRAIETAGVLS